MSKSQLARRRFLFASLSFSGLAVTGTSWLRESAAWAKSGDSAPLGRLARLLFPHDGLSDDVYRSVMVSVFDGFAANQASSSLLETAEAALDAQQSTAWKNLDEAAQVQAIAAIEGAPFFAAILDSIRGSFYYHPAVWKHINYPGSSKEHGGYKHRGFDDIDWLPKGE